MTIKEQATKGKLDKCDYNKQQFYAGKKTINKNNRKTIKEQTRDRVGENTGKLLI